jgi:purine-nucleoside phosphorylase
MTDKMLEEGCAFLARQTALRPRLGLVLGSGLSGFADKIKVAADIPFAKIPHFAVSSVDGHPGRLLLGHFADVPIAVMLGRLHGYEGLTPLQVAFPVRTLSLLGIKTLLVTNAAGGLKATMRPGDFMVISDHLNLTGDNPLRGPNLSIGPRFVDMTNAYDTQLRKILKDALRTEKVRAHEGVYVGVMGPAYETAAEVKLYAKMGGGSVGMSTVTEVLAARHAGVRVAGLSCITNLGTGLSKKKLTHEDVKHVAGQVSDKFARVVTTFIEKVKPHL